MSKYDRRSEPLVIDDRFWTVVLAVTLGICLAGAIGWGVRLWMLNQAMHEIGQVFTHSVEQSELSARRVEQAAAERARQLQAAEQQRLSLQRAAALQREAQLAAAQAKEAAWQRSYRKPPNCDSAEGPAFVECANHYIRAKRAFDAQYDAGKL